MLSSLRTSTGEWWWLFWAMDTMDNHMRTFNEALCQLGHPRDMSVSSFLNRNNWDGRTHPKRASPISGAESELK